MSSKLAVSAVNVAYAYNIINSEGQQIYIAAVGMNTCLILYFSFNI